MNRTIGAAWIVALVTGLFAVAAGAGEPWTGLVVGVADGDTITVKGVAGPVVIRLHGIDCPEKRQPFGSKAKTLTSTLAHGKTVTVGPVTKDRWGRLVASVTLDDGRDLGRELVRDGMAWWYRQYAPNDNQLRDLERAAREAKTGLWADPSPVEPWVWRKTHRGRQ